MKIEDVNIFKLGTALLVFTSEFFTWVFIADGAVYHACHKSTYSVLPEDYNWCVNVL